MNLNNINKIHFIGIGGIGVSAVARMMLGEGKIVSGSNLGQSEITAELKKLGATIFSEHNKDNLNDDVEMIVYSPAVPNDNPELRKAQELNIPCFSYPQALGLISKNKYTIAVSGTHGKTTTTAMISDILRNSNFNPTVIVGSLMKVRSNDDSGLPRSARNDDEFEKRTNFIKGESKYFIVEACEYKRSFLQLQPNILVITNIDIDHLDYYKDLADIQSAFRELVLKMGESDFVVCDPNDERVAPVVKDIKAKVVNVSDFDNQDFDLKIPGKYNQENARDAFAVSDILKIEKKEALKSLNDFEGTWRRFEYKGKTKNGALLYDDYAHNPTEIQAVLGGAKEFFDKKPSENGRRKITVIFQPHLYSRTKTLFDGFIESFKDVDKAIILPIYAAREINDPSINSQMLVEKIPNAEFSEYEDVDLSIFGENDVVITVGAGDVYKIGEKFL